MSVFQVDGAPGALNNSNQFLAVIDTSWGPSTSVNPDGTTTPVKWHQPQALHRTNEIAKMNLRR